MTHWTQLTQQLFELLQVVSRSVHPVTQFRLTDDVLNGMGPSAGGLVLAGLLVAVGYLAAVKLARSAATNGWLFATGGRHFRESALLMGDRCRSEFGPPACQAWRPHVSS